MDAGRLLRSAGIALALCTSPIAAAISLSPTSIALEDGDAAPVRVRVTAPATSALALDLQLMERHAGPSGEYAAPPTSATFELHPPQILVPAGASADIRLRWVGTLPADGSRSFYLVADQLPVATDSPGAPGDVQFLARIHLPMHVARGGASRVEIATTGQGGDLRVLITNRGTRYARLAPLELHIRRPDGTLRTLPGLDVARLIRADALLPHASAELDGAALGLQPGEQVVAAVDRP